MSFSSKVMTAILMSTALLVNAAEQEPEAGEPEPAIAPAKHEPAPPPPPGPYISTALSENDSFVGGHAVDEAGAPGHSPSFSPEMPWPDHRMPQKWMPDDGYRFAPPSMSMQPPLPQPAYRSRPPAPRPMRQDRQHHRNMQPAAPQRRQPAMRAAPQQQARQRPAMMPPRMQPPVNRGGAKRPSMRPPAMPPRQAQQGGQADNRRRGKSAPGPHMMDRRMMQRRDMPPPPAGPWLPLDHYPRW